MWLNHKLCLLIESYLVKRLIGKLRKFIIEPQTPASELLGLWSKCVGFFYKKSVVKKVIFGHSRLSRNIILSVNCNPEIEYATL